MKAKAKALRDAVRAWWINRGTPFVRLWWSDLDAQPGFHFMTAMAGIVLLYVMKFMAWMVM